MNRPSKADRWERLALRKQLQVTALQADNKALKAQLDGYKDALRELDGVMHFAGRVDYTGFVGRVKTVLMRVRKWERTGSAQQHSSHGE